MNAPIISGIDSSTLAERGVDLQKRRSTTLTKHVCRESSKEITAKEYTVKIFFDKRPRLERIAVALIALPLWIQGVAEAVVARLCVPTIACGLIAIVMVTIPFIRMEKD